MYICTPYIIVDEGEKKVEAFRFERRDRERDKQVRRMRHRLWVLGKFIIGSHKENPSVYRHRFPMREVFY